MILVPSRLAGKVRSIDYHMVIGHMYVLKTYHGVFHAHTIHELLENTLVYSFFRQERSDHLYSAFPKDVQHRQLNHI